MCPHCGALNTAPLWQDYNRDYADPFESHTRKSNTKKQELNKVDKDSKKTMSLILALCLPVLIFAFLVSYFGDQFSINWSDNPGFFWQEDDADQGDAANPDDEGDADDGTVPLEMTYYYDPENKVLLYHEGLGYRDSEYDTWWRYEEENKDWSLYYETLEPEFIDEVTSDDQYDLTEDPLHFIKKDMDYQDVAIEFSHGYVDEGNFHIPEYLDYYYECDGEYYFFYNTYDTFINDEEEDEDDTGWYRYDPEDGWQYYCSLDDHETLGDELWYRPLSHTLFTLKRYTTDYAKHYGFTDFRKTDVYLRHKS